MPRRITFSLQEGGSIVRAALESGHRPVNALRETDDRGLHWDELGICLMTLQTWARPTRVQELLTRNFVEEHPHRPFNFQGFNPTYLRSDTPFGRIYLNDDGEVVQDLAHLRRATC